MQIAALVLAFALAARSARADVCSLTDPSTGLVTCRLVGPIAGRFGFPDGVERFTLTKFTSGNGGDYNSWRGGYGSTIDGAATFEIAFGYDMPFYVGQNAGDQLGGARPSGGGGVPVFHRPREQL